MKITVAVLTLLGAFAAYYCLTKPLAVRMALPIGAVVSMDEVYESYPNGDYLHCLRAHISPTRFSDFAETMALQKGVGLVERLPACSADWWNSGLFKGVVFGNRNNTNESSTYAIYKDGWVYYVSHSY